MKTEFTNLIRFYLENGAFYSCKILIYIYGVFLNKPQEWHIDGLHIHIEYSVTKY